MLSGYCQPPEQGKYVSACAHYSDCHSSDYNVSSEILLHNTMLHSTGWKEEVREEGEGWGGGRDKRYGRDRDVGIRNEDQFW